MIPIRWVTIEYRDHSTRVIVYVNKDKQTFPLGRVTKTTAERFANNIDTLLHERRCNLPSAARFPTGWRTWTKHSTAFYQSEGWWNRE